MDWIIEFISHLFFIMLEEFIHKLITDSLFLGNVQSTIGTVIAVSDGFRNSNFYFFISHLDMAWKGFKWLITWPIYRPIYKDKFGHYVTDELHPSSPVYEPNHDWWPSHTERLRRQQQLYIWPHPQFGPSFYMGVDDGEAYWDCSGYWSFIYYYTTALEIAGDVFENFKFIVYPKISMAFCESYVPGVLFLILNCGDVAAEVNATYNHWFNKQGWDDWYETTGYRWYELIVATYEPDTWRKPPPPLPQPTRDFCTGDGRCKLKDHYEVHLKDEPLKRAVIDGWCVMIGMCWGSVVAHIVLIGLGY